jgi:hypothetical protein
MPTTTKKPPVAAVINVSNQSRYCYDLKRHIEPGEVATVGEDFQKCHSCGCVTVEEAPEVKEAA